MGCEAGMVLNNHELAKRYKEKSKLIGKDILKLKLLSRNRVELVEVLDKEDTGRLVIPSFITDIHWHMDNGILIDNALMDCKFSEVYVDNNRDINLKGLCANMGSDKLKVGVRDISKITGMSNMFDGCIFLTHLDISGLSGENRVRDMGSMFNACGRLSSINFGGLDTSKVKDMSNMFSGCANLELSSEDLRVLNTSNVKFMDGMFSNNLNLRSIDMSLLNTRKVESMSRLFNGCTELEYINIDGVDMTRVKDCIYMFAFCEQLKNIDFSKVKVRRLKDTRSMFIGCRGLEFLNISNISISNLDLDVLLKQCRLLKRIAISSNIDGTSRMLLKQYMDKVDVIYK